MPNWYLLGLQLEVSGDELDVIERNYPRDNHMCMLKMFGAWLRLDASATYRKLVKALTAVGKRNIAEVLCTARGMEVTALCFEYPHSQNHLQKPGNEVAFEGTCVHG